MAPTRHRIEIFDLLREAYRTLARNPNVVIVNNSAAGAADYERWLGVPAGTIRVHYNGFMPESVRRPEPHEILELRRSLRLPGDARVVGTVIRFVEDKDPDLWLDTAAEIANARPDVWYLLAGYGPLRDAIMHRIRSLGLGDRVILPGPVTDIGLVLAVLDVVLLTSIVEGVPNVLIEAQAAGRPVVTTDVGGTCEAILEGRTGRIVPQRSAKLLAEAVTGILDDPAWPARARTEGPAFVAGRFGLDRLVRETLDIYDLQRQAPFGASRPEQAGVGIM